MLFSDTYMPLFVLLIFLRLSKSIGKQENILLIYCIFNVIVFALSNVFAENGIHNMPLYHLNSLVDVWLVSYYLLKKITGKAMSVPFIIINVGYTIFFICNILFWEKLTDFNSNSAGVTSLVILFLSMQYLLKFSKTDEILYFQKLPSFWIASGFLIYSALSVLVLLSYKYFLYLKMYSQGNSLWFVLSAGIIIKFALISIGLICHKKRPATHLPFLL